MLLAGKQGRGTKKERPRLSWLVDAELELRNMGVKRTARILCVSYSSTKLRYDNAIQGCFKSH